MTCLLLNFKCRFKYTFTKYERDIICVKYNFIMFVRDYTSTVFRFIRILEYLLNTHYIPHKNRAVYVLYVIWKISPRVFRIYITARQNVTDSSRDLIQFSFTETNVCELLWHRFRSARTFIQYDTQRKRFAFIYRMIDRKFSRIVVLATGLHRQYQLPSHAVELRASNSITQSDKMPFAIFARYQSRQIFFVTCFIIEFNKRCVDCINYWRRVGEVCILA